MKKEKMRGGRFDFGLISSPKQEWIDRLAQLAG